MAEAAKKSEDSKESEGKTIKVEILKFHPLVVHEVGETVDLHEASAKELIDRDYAKIVK